MVEDRNMELSAMINDRSAFDRVHLSLMIHVRHFLSPDEQLSVFLIILIFTGLQCFAKNVCMRMSSYFITILRRFLKIV